MSVRYTKRVMSCRTLGIEAKRGLYECVVVPTVFYGAETLRVSAEERSRLSVFEMKYLWGMVAASLRDQ